VLIFVLDKRGGTLLVSI